MTQAELDSMFLEVEKEKALLRLSDKQILALDLHALDDWELVVDAEQFLAMGKCDLWLEALKRVCCSPEHNVTLCVTR